MKIIFKIFLLFILINPFIITLDNNKLSYSYSGELIYADSGGGGGNMADNSIELVNPLAGGNISDIPTFVEKLLEVVMKVGVPLVAVAIIYTGYLFISAQGNPEKLKKAKDAILYVFIGAMILLGAYVIAQALHGTINAIRGN